MNRNLSIIYRTILLYSQLASDQRQITTAKGNDQQAHSLDAHAYF